MPRMTYLGPDNTEEIAEFAGTRRYMLAVDDTLVILQDGRDDLVLTPGDTLVRNRKSLGVVPGDLTDDHRADIARRRAAPDDDQ